MTKIKVSDYISVRLKEVYNIKNIFMVTGGHAMHLNDSFGANHNYTCFHHEQAASMAAEGYARENQELAVVNVTTGPGGINCLNGVFGQWTDSVPVLYISGQVKRETSIKSCPELELRQLGDQEADIISIVKPITKYAVTINNPNEVKYHLDKAIYEATTGRKGPVWLDIPMDIQSGFLDEETATPFVPEKEKNYDCKITEVSNHLNKAKRPLIVAGHGIRLSNQIENFLELVEKFNIPVVTTFNGNDCISTEHKLHVGRIGTIGQRAGNFALQNADVVLFLGTRNNIRQTSYNWENYAKNALKIIVDIDENELKKPSIKPDLAINTDLKAFIPELLKINYSLKNEQWIEYCSNIKEKYSFKNTKEYQQNKEKINPYYFIRKLSENFKNNDSVICANATATICLFQVGKQENNRCIMNSGSASMGYGLPTAIGNFIYKKDNNINSQTICIEGDGSIMMNLQELQTIKNYNLPIKIFIINNGGYSSCTQTQTNFFNGHFVGCSKNTGVGLPDFTEIGKAFGIKSIKLENPEEIEETIKTILDEKEPIICEVLTEENYSFTPKLASRKLENGQIKTPSLEDMYPHLSEEELSKNMFS